MSSWSSGKVHFRERRMPSPKVIPQVYIPNSEIKTEKIISDYPSKYFIPKSNTNDAVVCTIAFEEDLYVDEWIKYNLALGFSHIYIYDNSENNSLKEKKSHNVTIIHIPGDKMMRSSRNLFLLQYKNKHKWVAHIDLDEFIVLKKHNSIIDFLNEYNDCDSIALNWLMFGTSNQIYYKNEPITKRFQYCSKDLNNHYKCISKIQSIQDCVHSHRPLLKNGNIYDTNRKVVKEIFNPDGDYNIALIHHYYSKSEEEFKLKIARKMVDEAPKRDEALLNDIHLQNNDVYNTDAWDFYSKHLEQKPS